MNVKISVYPVSFDKYCNDNLLQYLHKCGVPERVACECRTPLYVEFPINIIPFGTIASPGFLLYTTSVRTVMHYDSPIGYLICEGFLDF